MNTQEVFDALEALLRENDVDLDTAAAAAIALLTVMLAAALEDQEPEQIDAHIGALCFAIRDRVRGLLNKPAEDPSYA